MKLLTANRAIKLLYNFIQVNHISGRVLLPANICPEVVKMLTFAGMQPQFLDLQVETLCLDMQAALDQAKDAQMIIFVHTFGTEQEFAPFFQLLREQNPDIIIIDDKCLCLPDLELKQSEADLVLYSTGERKMVPLGGGAIGYLADKWEYDEVAVEGCDCLSNELWLLDPKQLYQRMDTIISHKDKLNTIYSQMLPAAIQLPDQFQHWRFNILVPNQQQILAALEAEGLKAETYYPSQDEACLVASNLHRYVINLFNDKSVTQEQAERTCEVICSLLG